MIQLLRFYLEDLNLPLIIINKYGIKANLGMPCQSIHLWFKTSEEGTLKKLFKTGFWRLRTHPASVPRNPQLGLEINFPGQGTYFIIAGSELDFT